MDINGALVITHNCLSVVGLYPRDADFPRRFEGGGHIRSEWMSLERLLRTWRLPSVTRCIGLNEVYVIYMKRNKRSRDEQDQDRERQEQNKTCSDNLLLVSYNFYKK